MLDIFGTRFLSTVAQRTDPGVAVVASLSLQVEEMLANVARLIEARGGEEKMFGLRQALSQAIDVKDRAVDDYNRANKVWSACSVAAVL